MTILVTDEEGNKAELEHQDTIEYEGQIYVSFLPTDMDEDNDDYGLVILKVIDDGEEAILTSVDDDDERGEVFARFLANHPEEDSD